jgi:divalent metal cation (Fe/Co/Zn/Cd) transporter
MTGMDEKHDRTALWLAVFTVAYNVCEGAVSVAFATQDRSAALLGFGADSFVESLSGMVMVWRFSKPEGAEEREHRAARLVGVTFLVLAGYVAYEAVSTLMGSESSQRSLAALVIAALSLLVMPTLFLLKRRIAKTIGSRSLLADARQTLACMMLSVVLLVGAGLNWFGIWKADAIAALVIVAYLVKEGWESLTTRELCEC